MSEKNSGNTGMMDVPQELWLALGWAEGAALLPPGYAADAMSPLEQWLMQCWVGERHLWR